MEEYKNFVETNAITLAILLNKLSKNKDTAWDYYFYSRDILEYIKVDREDFLRVIRDRIAPTDKRFKVKIDSYRSGNIDNNERPILFCIPLPYPIKN